MYRRLLSIPFIFVLDSDFVTFSMYFLQNEIKTLLLLSLLYLMRQIPRGRKHERRSWLSAALVGNMYIIACDVNTFAKSLWSAVNNGV